MQLKEKMRPNYGSVYLVDFVPLQGVIETTSALDLWIFYLYIRVPLTTECTVMSDDDHVDDGMKRLLERNQGHV
jgi:hypothetical protein